MTSDKVKAYLMLAGAAGVVYMIYKAKQGMTAAVETAEILVKEDLNPASDQNVIYRNVPLSVKDKIMNFYEWVGL